MWFMKKLLPEEVSKPEKISFPLLTAIGLAFLIPTTFENDSSYLYLVPKLPVYIDLFFI